MSGQALLQAVCRKGVNIGGGHMLARLRGGVVTGEVGEAAAVAG